MKNVFKCKSLWKRTAEAESHKMSRLYSLWFYREHWAPSTSSARLRDVNNFFPFGPPTRENGLKCDYTFKNVINNEP
jgi:hypothetical protein